MISIWNQENVVLSKEHPLLDDRIALPSEYRFSYFRSLNTAAGKYYLVYDDEAYRDGYESNSFKLLLYDGVKLNTLMRNLKLWKNRFEKDFFVFSAYTSRTIYLIDSRGIIFEITTHIDHLVFPYYEVGIDREKGCYLVNGNQIFYLTKEERTAFQTKTRSLENIAYNKDFNRFVRANTHNRTDYLYLTGGASKCGEFIRFFSDRGMEAEIVPNLLLDDSTINIRIPLDGENTKRDEVHFLCAKYSNQYSIFNIPFDWIGGGLSFPEKWIQKKYDLGFYIPKGKDTLVYSVINNLRAAYGTFDDYELFKKTLSKVVRLFERGNQRPFQNRFTELLLLYPTELECTKAYALSKLEYINSLLIGTEEIRLRERQEYIDFLKRTGFDVNIHDIDNRYLNSKLTAEDIVHNQLEYNYLYKLACKRAKQVYKDKMKGFESQILKEMSENGYRISKWKNESTLFSVVVQKYSDAIYQYRCDWLGLQSLDIYIPSLRIGIEYQGEQHYRPIEFFGGEDAFNDLVRRDKQKEKLCKENGVQLILWRYDETISKAALEKRIKQISED